MSWKLKPENKDKVVAFNNSAAPLGKRKDLEKLVEMALRSGQKSLLDLFDDLPTLEGFLNKKAESLVKK